MPLCRYAGATGPFNVTLIESADPTLLQCILREYARGKAAGETRGITFLVQALMAFYEGHPDPAWRGRFRAILLKDMGIVLDIGRATGHVTPVLGMVDSFYRVMDGPK